MPAWPSRRELEHHIQDIPRAQPHPTTPLEHLAREQGLTRFGFFFVTAEGRYLPNGAEEKSGYVVDDRGRAFAFWTGWDEAAESIQFAEWEQVEIEDAWNESSEYRRARAAAGLVTA